MQSLLVALMFSPKMVDANPLPSPESYNWNTFVTHVAASSISSCTKRCVLKHACNFRQEIVGWKELGYNGLLMNVLLTVSAAILL